jgi:hypothetical protein
VPRSLVQQLARKSGGPASAAAHAHAHLVLARSPSELIARSPDSKTARGASRDVRADFFPACGATSCLSQPGHFGPRKHAVKGKKQISRLRRLHIAQDVPRPQGKKAYRKQPGRRSPRWRHGPIGLIRLQVVFEMAATSKGTAAQRVLVPSLLAARKLNEMVAARKKSRLRPVVIQRRSGLKAQGAAEKGCAKVLQSHFFSGSCA